jgi:hypothetical protein
MILVPDLLEKKGIAMAKKTLILLVAASIAIFIQVDLLEAKDDKEIIKVFYDNLEAMEREDIKAYMATIHEASPGYALTEQVTAKAFDLYDLKYTVDELEVIEESKGEAKVKFMMTTKKIRGPEFRDNRIKGVHILKKSKGKWKIFKTVPDNIEYFN